MKSVKYILTNIVWDVDEDDTDVELPSRETVEIAESGLAGLTEDELEDYGFADWLSDKYGWCVVSFNWEVLDEEE